MIFDILAIIFPMQCANIFARLLDRRDDVLHYVPKSNPV